MNLNTVLLALSAALGTACAADGRYTWSVATRKVTLAGNTVRLTDSAMVRQRVLTLTVEDGSLESAEEALQASGTCSVEVAIAAAEHCLVLGL